MVVQQSLVSSSTYLFGREFMQQYVHVSVSRLTKKLAVWPGPSWLRSRVECSVVQSRFSIVPLRGSASLGHLPSPPRLLRRFEMSGHCRSMRCQLMQTPGDAGPRSRKSSWIAGDHPCIGRGGRAGQRSSW